MTIDTTSPQLRSFIDVPPESHFPIQNLPYGVFRRRDAEEPRVGVAIGEWVLDLVVLERRGALRIPDSKDREVFDRPSLNAFLELGTRNTPRCSSTAKSRTKAPMATPTRGCSASRRRKTP